MLYEFTQINAIGNGSSTICYIVTNPRLENGLCTVDIVGTYAGRSEEYEGEYVYQECAPKKMVVGGNFTMVEYTRELIAGNSKSR